MSLTWSAHISWLFLERPYLERVAEARRAGFSLIESAWPPQDARDGLAATVAREGVGVALLNCPAGDLASGERGVLNDPGRREEAERGFIEAAQLAEQIGARSLNVLVGRALPGISLARQRAAVLGALREFGEEADARGLRLVLEPLNAIENPGYLAPTPESAAELIAQSGSRAIGLLLDVYHVARGGGDPVAAIERNGPLIDHVQVSDCPGRGRPGSGELDIWGILETLDATGYAGAIGLEYEPRGATQDTLGFMRDPRSPVHPDP